MKVKSLPKFCDSKLKIAAFDLDETTLHEGVMSEYTARAINETAGAGIVTVVASGRDLSQISPEDFSHFSIGVVCNGSLIVRTDKVRRDGNALVYTEAAVLHRHTLSNEAAVRVFDTIRRFGGASYILRGEGILGEEKTLAMACAITPEKSVEEVKKLWGWKTRVYTDDLARELEKRPNLNFKIKCFLPDEKAQQLALNALTRDKELCTLTMLGNTLEVTAAGVDKGSGLKWLAGSMGLGIENVVVFGDSGNDMAMFECGAFAVAMGNATPEIKEKADFICDSIENEGSAKALFHMLGKTE